MPRRQRFGSDISAKRRKKAASSIRPLLPARGKTAGRRVQRLFGQQQSPGRRLGYHGQTVGGSLRAVSINDKRGVGAVERWGLRHIVDRRESACLQQERVANLESRHVGKRTIVKVQIFGRRIVSDKPGTGDIDRKRRAAIGHDMTEHHQENVPGRLPATGTVSRARPGRARRGSRTWRTTTCGEASHKRPQRVCAPARPAGNAAAVNAKAAVLKMGATSGMNLAGGISSHPWP